ncbi:TM2 domain-containing protein [Gracilimonas mengyeensis]|uniref:TM2 domain-containing protein n=1 Tax=Gracilimonas mengyeensis TaxID=1302730 RepID=A0A521AIC7_9BACT|nr:TM2 domain-containing protein [Gracilimonas mengyeensis]SMO34595.1 TM2 domain-containing protein [Gracilimonas mengyeensis]
MATLIDHLPEVSGDEARYLERLLENYNEQQISRFSNIYRSRRKDPQHILIACLFGFLSIAGIHRILLNQTAMGLLYLFTGGLCLIGTIVDLVNYKEMTFDYNRDIARDVKSYVDKQTDNS